MLPLAFLLLLARWPEAAPLPAVDDFHAQMIRRFSDGRGFGMSRIVRWNTLGHHFNAPPGAKLDFIPENDAERAVMERWSRDGWQAGLYVFGASIKSEPLQARFHRALKGPGVLQEGTPRGELPKWEEVYPVAWEAMRRFELGAPGYSAVVAGWTLHARPVAASKEACAQCHNAGAAHLNGATKVTVGDVLGGVIYLLRR